MGSGNNVVKLVLYRSRDTTTVLITTLVTMFMIVADDLAGVPKTLIKTSIKVQQS